MAEFGAISRLFMLNWQTVLELEENMNQVRVSANLGRFLHYGQNFVTVCDSCGNETLKTHITGFGGNPQYKVYQCGICSVAILYSIDEEGIWEQLWPTPANLPLDVQIPERVRNLYNEAKLVERRSPSSFAIQIGRALEAMVKDQEAEGKTLNEKLNNLIEKGTLPGSIGEMVHIQRILRNLGAHDDKVDVDMEDAIILDDFFNAVIDYVYIAPDKIKRVKERIATKLGSAGNVPPVDKPVENPQA